MGDAAYHGKPLLVEGTTSSPPGCPPTPRSTRSRRRRAPADAADHGAKATGSANPPTWPAPRQWQRVRVRPRYGHTEDRRDRREAPSIWYGAFGNTAGRTVLVREPGRRQDLGDLHHRHRQRRRERRHPLRVPVAVMPSSALRPLSRGSDYAELVAGCVARVAVRFRALGIIRAVAVG